MHPRIDTVVFLVSSYHGHTLEWIDRAYCRLIAGDEELARFTLTLDIRETGPVMVTIFRDGQQWRLRAIGEGIDARIPAESIEAMKRFLGLCGVGLTCSRGSRPEGVPGVTVAAVHQSGPAPGEPTVSRLTRVPAGLAAVVPPAVRIDALVHHMAPHPMPVLEGAAP